MEYTKGYTKGYRDVDDKNGAICLVIMFTPILIKSPS